ncbi:SRPBCC domain-containing protein [Allorhizobium taibaishanense]|uniref:Uncharacterized protein YndB with AHSA1/START domain n=1 Tax=Allorhizobium taibaishanense TaxID=887144 RepID=A0A1Q9A0T5_9HYPH|nr:SRPBCC domain-containing protein [Allorhizobium taibaishanense]MBB4007757.1 uncharacterized protein YndB with AHSA1/START domain [Allorhizobium taibaishanense]OLP48106.1 hypothetical protein BJF91_08090 [Allorhizobium taibaishanense]
MANSIRIDRTIQAPVSRVYGAFLDGKSISRWMERKDYTCKPLSFDPEVGGIFRLEFSNASVNLTYVIIGEFEELSVNQRIRYCERLDSPGWTSRVETVIDFAPASRGTALTVTQSNLPATVSPHAITLAWQECLDRLAALTEQMVGSLQTQSI